MLDSVSSRIGVVYNNYMEQITFNTMAAQQDTNQDKSTRFVSPLKVKDRLLVVFKDNFRTNLW